MDPIDEVVPKVHGVGTFGQHPYLKRVPVPDGFESLVPPPCTFEQRGPHRSDEALRLFEDVQKAVPNGSPDVSPIVEAKLHDDLPPTSPPTTPLHEVIDVMLREVEKAILGTEREPSVNAQK